MRPEIKRRRDKARFEKYGGMNLVKELILKLPVRQSYSRGHVLETAMQIASRKINRKRTKQKYFLAETIVRQAVGNGYLTPQNGRYVLSKKAKKFIERAINDAEKKVLMILDDTELKFGEGDKYTIIVEVDESRKFLEERCNYLDNGITPHSSDGVVFYLTKKHFQSFLVRDYPGRFGKEIRWESLPYRVKKSLAGILFGLGLLRGGKQ